MYNANMQPPHIDAIQRNRLSVKSFLGSSNALSIAILYTISIVLSIVSSITSVFYLPSLFRVLSYELGYDIQASTSFSFSLPIFPILTAIAFFLLYSAGRNKNPNTPNSAGATMLLVISIIQLVLFALAFVAVIIVLVLMIVLMSSVSSASSEFDNLFELGFINGYTSEASILTIVLIIVAAILIAFLILYLVYLIGMIKLSSSIKNGLNTATLSPNGATAVGVCYVFFSIFSGISMVITIIFSGFLIAVISSMGIIENPLVIVGLILSAVSSVLAFALNISMAKFAFSFKKHVLTEAQPVPQQYNAPQDIPIYNNPQPVYNPQQPIYSEATPSAPAYNVPDDYSNNEYSDDAYITDAPAETLYAPENINSQPVDNAYQNYAPAPVTPVYTGNQETTLLNEESYTPNEAYSIPASLVCPVCGNAIFEGQAFCAECGNKLI